MYPYNSNMYFKRLEVKGVILLVDYEKFKELVFKKTGLNLSFYKERQMKRRIDSLIKRNNFNDYGEYFNERSEERRVG